MLAATLLGVLHHHDDLKPHNDCPICVLQSNLSSGDMPQETPLLTVENLPVDIAASPVILKISSRPTRLSARSPPYLS